jgi:hypothetical protein
VSSRASARREVYTGTLQWKVSKRVIPSAPHRRAASGTPVSYSLDLIGRDGSCDDVQMFHSKEEETLKRLIRILVIALLHVASYASAQHQTERVRYRLIPFLW